MNGGMINPSRRRLLSVAAAPLVPAHVGSMLSSGSVLDVCRQYREATLAAPVIERALKAALIEAGRLQTLLHHVEDLPAHCLDLFEVMPVQTVEEAQAKNSVALDVLREGIDPKRHEFMAAASAELHRVRGA